MTVEALQVRPTTICWPWRLREMGTDDGQHPIGAECRKCGREVALPRSYSDGTPLCVYCAMDAGLIPLTEIEP